MPNYRKPDARKRVAGTFRKDRSKAKPPAKSVIRIPEPPEHLSEAARAEWRALAPRVCELRIMTSADLRGFQMLCETLATASAAQAAIDRDGVAIGEGGKVKSHPSLKTLEAARAGATRLLIEFGLTPRARGHVEPAGEAPSNNPFLEIG